MTALPHRESNASNALPSQRSAQAQGRGKERRERTVLKLPPSLEHFHLNDLVWRRSADVQHLQILPYVASTVRSMVPQMVSEVGTNTAKLDPDRFGMQHASTSPTVDTVPGQTGSRIVRSRPLQSVSGFATFPELALPVRKSGPETVLGSPLRHLSDVTP